MKYVLIIEMHLRSIIHPNADLKVTSWKKINNGWMIWHWKLKIERIYQGNIKDCFKTLYLKQLKIAKKQCDCSTELICPIQKKFQLIE